MSRGPHDSDGTVLTTLKDVLERPFEIDAERVHYRPSPVEKRYLEGYVHPERVEPPAGPDVPSVTVRWSRRPSPTAFRIDYADPNVAFHCGWHRDGDHDEYGDVHFQYDHPGLATPTYEAATFDATTPPRILWDALDRLFDDVVPSLVGPLYD